MADREGFAVYSPIFPESLYDSDEYQRGGIVDDNDRVLPEDQWTTRLEEPMVEWARSQVDGDEDVYLFGFSAGGQYLSRVAAYERPEGITRIVVASPSTWVLPSLTEDAPYGFDGLGTDAEEREALREYLALPMTILLGSEDDDPNDPDLATGAAAMRQGSNRLERGINTFEMGQEVAEANGWEFNWTIVIADGVGHSGSSMLRAPEMTEALHPVDAPGNGVPYDIALTGSSVDETAAGGTVVGRLSARDPDDDALHFSVTGDSRFAVQGSDLVVVAGADLTGNGDREVNLTVSASDGRGGVANASITVTIKDILDGGDGNDVLYGGAGNDTLHGRGGNDTLDGRLGANSMYGGGGDDTYIVDDIGDNVIENENEGYHDNVLTDLTRFTLSENVENITTIGATGVNFTGNGLGNILNGGAGGDTLFGLGGADTLKGHSGSDRLVGGVGTDSLYGGDGGDVLTGGAGADSVDVGAANDDTLDRVRYFSSSDFGNSVINFDVNGTADKVEFAGALNGAWDDIANSDSFHFASSNGAAGSVAANLNTRHEALYLAGAPGEGVTTANLHSEEAVATAFNKEFIITARNGEDAFLVVNDTDGNSFSAWQWVQVGGGEMTAEELSLVGIFAGNGTVKTASFDFLE